MSKELVAQDFLEELDIKGIWRVSLRASLSVDDYPKEYLSVNSSELIEYIKERRLKKPGPKVKRFEIEQRDEDSISVITVLYGSGRPYRGQPGYGANEEDREYTNIRKVPFLKYAENK